MPYAMCCLVPLLWLMLFGCTIAAMAAAAPATDWLWSVPISRLWISLRRVVVVLLFNGTVMLR